MMLFTRTLKTFAVTIAVMFAVTVSATPAHADEVWSDSVEGATPWDHWQANSGGDGQVGYDINRGFAHSGANNGWLFVGNGWAANRIPVNVSNWTRDRCGVSVWFNPVTAAGAQVGLQVWNPNGWHIIAETYPWYPGFGYRQAWITGLDLRGYTGDVYLQVIYGKPNGPKTFVRFDDLALGCYTPPR